MEPKEKRPYGALSMSVECSPLVFMRPVERSTNPYPLLLANAIRAEGLRVEQMSRNVVRFPWQADVIVLHWPDEFFLINSLKGAMKALTLLTFLSVKRVTGAKLVWIVHNIIPHNRSRLRFEFARKWFFRKLDGLIYLSESSRRDMYKVFPEVMSLRSIVIPHGVYETEKVSIAKSREFDGGLLRVAFIGRVMRYKAPEILANVVNQVPHKSIHLVIVGKCAEEDLKIELAKQESPQVELQLKYHEEEDLISIVDNVDAVILPYRDIVNSGSVMFALTRSRPVLAPRLGSLVELQEQVGCEWLYLFEGDFNLAVLENFYKWMAKRSSQAKPNLVSYQWDTIGHEAAKFLTDL